MFKSLTFSCLGEVSYEHISGGGKVDPSLNRFNDEKILFSDDI